MILCAGNEETFSFATPVGVGLVEVAIGVTKICLLNPPSFLLFVGSAGSYGEHSLFDIVHSQSASQIENSFFLSDTYTPIDNMISTSADVSRETFVNSSNYITTDSSLGKKYLAHNIGLENMEFFSILSVAKTFGIPVGGIFIVTNYCNATAHEDFLANHKTAMAKLEEYIATHARKWFR
ncbi:MAG TPA: purine-nucleoside phosphorylase [Epsilonproteobacteria bacterium]|nr:purine-nucleoside phosphorylase [Campylobacterota bacterium]